MRAILFTQLFCLQVCILSGQNLFPFKDSTHKYGLKNKKGDIILEPYYQSIYEFSGNLALVSLGGRYGYIDTTGKLIIPIQFKEASPFYEGLAAAYGDTLYGYIDTTGKFVIPAKYDYANPFSEGLAYVHNWNKPALSGFINKTGKLVIPVRNIIHRYTRKGATYFQEGLAMVYACNGDAEECQYGYMNKAGKIVIPIKYWDAHSFQNGLALVWYNSKYYLINKTGSIAATLKYDRAEDFSEGLAAVGIWKVVDGKDATMWGYCDKTGRLVIPALYSEADAFQNGLADVILNGVKLKIDKTGKVAQ